MPSSNSPVEGIFLPLGDSLEKVLSVVNPHFPDDIPNSRILEYYSLHRSDISLEKGNVGGIVWL
jgi:hypothetical protein